MQDMLQPLMGALGPLTQSLGKANPLQSVGQMAQQLGQQVGKLGGDAAKKAASPLNPAALAKPLAGAGKGRRWRRKWWWQPDQAREQSQRRHAPRVADRYTEGDAPDRGDTDEARSGSRRRVRRRHGGHDAHGAQAGR